MANNPNVSGDILRDSWALGITQEHNAIMSRENHPTRGRELPDQDDGTIRFGTEFYLEVIDGSNQPGWYKYVDRTTGWTSI